MRIVVCSQFFLDTQIWLWMAEDVLPRLGARERSLKIWSAGGGSGKEAYSAAILLDGISPGSRHDILATDKDERALAIGKAGGPYTLNDVETLSDDEKAAYLIGEPPRYFVSSQMRSQVAFRKHDLLCDPYPVEYDWILYRDVEPFFNEAERTIVCRRLHSALAAGGILFMGAVERIPCAESLGFRHRAESVYEKMERSCRL